MQRECASRRFATQIRLLCQTPGAPINRCDAAAGGDVAGQRLYRSLAGFAVASILAFVMSLAMVTHAAAAPLLDDAPSLPATPELIEQAFAAGEISAEERLLYLAYAVYEPASLPERFESDTPWSGTGVVAELTGAMANLESSNGLVSAATADELNSLFQTQAATVCDRPDPANSFNSDHFHFNYDTIGGGLTINDYAMAMDKVFSVQVNDYGWAQPPLCTAGVGGCGATNPWNRYPVQVAGLSNGLYGYVTAPGGSYAAFMGDNPNTPAIESAALSSCMVLNQDYTGFPGTPLLAMRATVAHEFAHSIQFGYGDPAPSEIGMWYESTAAYAEDEVFDDANDNYGYLYPPFDRCLGNAPSNSILVYHNWLFFRYAAERSGGTNLAGGGEEIFETFWANVATGERALDAYGDALAVQGAAFGNMYHDYAITAGFMEACPASAPYCFEEAAGYVGTEGLPATHGQINAVGDIVEETLENHFALNWIQLPLNGPYSVRSENLSVGGQFRVSIVASTPSGLDVQPLPALINGNESLALSNYAPPPGATRVLAVITNEQKLSSAPSSCTANPYRLSTATATPTNVTISVDAPEDIIAEPGDELLHRFLLRNEGSEGGAFTLAATSSLGWADTSTLPISVTVPSGDEVPVSIPVLVPADALAGAEEVTELTATYVDDSAIQAAGAVRTALEADLEPTSFLPLVLNNGSRAADCVADPPGESSNIEDARTICSGQQVSGSVSVADEDIDDVYRIEVTDGQVLAAELSGMGGDVDLYLYRGDTTDVQTDPWASASGSDGNEETIRIFLTEGGPWYVDVFAYDGETDYTLTVATVPNDGFYSCTPDTGNESSNIDDAIRVCSGQLTQGAVGPADDARCLQDPDFGRLVPQRHHDG